MIKRFLGYTAKTTEEHIVLAAIVSIIVAVLFVGLALIFIMFIGIANAYSLLDVSKTGPIGDTFNGITGPVIALTLAVLTFLAFYVQFQFNKEQLAFNNKQIINSSFFELFKIHIENVKNLETTYVPSNMYYHEKRIYHNTESYVGKEYFTALSNQLLDSYYEELTHAMAGSNSVMFLTLHYTGSDVQIALNKDNLVVRKFFDSLDHEKLSEMYFEVVYENNSRELGYYFRNLYTIFNFIKNSTLEKIEKHVYYDLIKAQLSEHELFILHYNLLHPYGKKFLALLQEEELSLFKHINTNQFLENINPQDLGKFGYIYNP